jgi:hypothetical protein
MSQSGIGFWIMFAPGTGYNLGIKAGRFIIRAEENGQSVIQGVFYNLHGR